MSDITFGRLKKRILDTLGEYSPDSSAVYVADTARDTLISKMPDVISGAIVRMYESLPIGIKEADIRLYRQRKLFESFTLKDEKKVSFDTSELAVCFSSYSSGSFVIEDGSGKEVLCADFSGNGVKRIERMFVSLESCGEYTLKVKDGLDILGLVIYENDGSVKRDGIAPYGYVSAELPEDFGSVIKLGNCKDCNNLISFADSEGYGFFNDVFFKNCDEVHMTYKSKPVSVTETTEDTYIISMPSLAVEALVCLCASELCREGNTSLYTRLYYKYADLAEGLHTAFETRRKNSFFSGGIKKRWQHGIHSI